MSTHTRYSELELDLRFQHQLAERIGRDRFDLWFGKTSQWSVSQTKVIVVVEHEFLADCVRNFCLDDIRSVAGEFFAVPPIISISTEVDLRADVTVAACNALPKSESHRGRQPAEANRQGRLFDFEEQEPGFGDRANDELIGAGDQAGEIEIHAGSRRQSASAGGEGVVNRVIGMGNQGVETQVDSASEDHSFGESTVSSTGASRKTSRDNYDGLANPSKSVDGVVPSSPVFEPSVYRIAASTRSIGDPSSSGKGVQPSPDQRSADQRSPGQRSPGQLPTVSSGSDASQIHSPSRMPTSSAMNSPILNSPLLTSTASKSPQSRSFMNSPTWTHFVRGACNQLALSGAEMVIERPGHYTPVLLHGPTGSGKTMLARLIGESLKTRHHLRRVVFITAEQFLVDYTESVRGSGFASFRSKYRDLHCLVLEDLHFLLGKGNTLIELRSTLEQLLNQNRQVILTADRSLGELTGLGSELHTRLSGGLSCTMLPIDRDSRLGILRQLCECQDLRIDETALALLADRAGGDARPLKGFVLRLVMHQRIHGAIIDCDSVVNVCSDLLQAAKPVVRLLDIERVVCEAFGLGGKSLQEASKAQAIAQPRMLAMFLARKFTSSAYSDIGKHFGNRRHSTVISAEKKVNDWLSEGTTLPQRQGKVAVREIIKALEASLKLG